MTLVARAQATYAAPRELEAAPVAAAKGRYADAVKIAAALASDAPRLFGPDVRRIAREIVIPITAERADVVVLGDLTWMVEIKSGRDSLKRLRRQATAFERVGDRCVLAVASRHLPAALGILPSWWGVIEVVDGPALSLEWYRLAKPNPAVDRRTLLLLLRREEAEAALAGIDGRCRKARKRMSLLAELDSCLDDWEVAACVRGALLRRRRCSTPPRNPLV